MIKKLKNRGGMKNVQNTIFFYYESFISEKIEDTNFMLQLLILLTASHSSYNQIQLWAKKSDLSEYDLIEEQCVELTLFKSDPMNNPNSKVDRFIFRKVSVFIKSVSKLAIKFKLSVK